MLLKKILKLCCDCHCSRHLHLITVLSGVVSIAMHCRSVAVHLNRHRDQQWKKCHFDSVFIFTRFSFLFSTISSSIFLLFLLIFFFFLVVIFFHFVAAAWIWSDIQYRCLDTHYSMLTAIFSMTVYDANIWYHFFMHVCRRFRLQSQQNFTGKSWKYMLFAQRGGCTPDPLPIVREWGKFQIFSILILWKKPKYKFHTASYFRQTN